MAINDHSRHPVAVVLNVYIKYDTYTHSEPTASDPIPNLLKPTLIEPISIHFEQTYMHRAVDDLPGAANTGIYEIRFYPLLTYFPNNGIFLLLVSLCSTSDK